MEMNSWKKFCLFGVFIPSFNLDLTAVGASARSRLDEMRRVRCIIFLLEN